MAYRHRRRNPLLHDGPALRQKWMGTALPTQRHHSFHISHEKTWFENIRFPIKELVAAFSISIMLFLLLNYTSAAPQYLFDALTCIFLFFVFLAILAIESRLRLPRELQWWDMAIDRRDSRLTKYERARFLLRGFFHHISIAFGASLFCFLAFNISLQTMPSVQHFPGLDVQMSQQDKPQRLHSLTDIRCYFADDGWTFCYEPPSPPKKTDWVNPDRKRFTMAKGVLYPRHFINSFLVALALIPLFACISAAIAARIRNSIRSGVYKRCQYRRPIEYGRFRLPKTELPEIRR